MRTSTTITVTITTECVNAKRPRHRPGVFCLLVGQQASGGPRRSEAGADRYLICAQAG